MRQPRDSSTDKDAFSESVLHAEVEPDLRGQESTRHIAQPLGEIHPERVARVVGRRWGNSGCIRRCRDPIILNGAVIGKQRVRVIERRTRLFELASRHDAVGRDVRR